MDRKPKISKTMGLLALSATLFVSPSVHAACDLNGPAAELYTSADKERYQGLYKSRSRGLAGALYSNDIEERLTIANLMRSMDQVADGEKPAPAASSLAGDFSCQVMKLGKGTNIVIYKAFRCRIKASGKTADVVKLSGSQLFTGTFHPSGSGFAYIGADHIYDEAPRAYGTDAKRNQVGCLTVLDSDQMVLELSRPYYDSEHDMVVFTRR